MSEPLHDQIREAKPVASEELRSRIRALGAAEPVRQPLLARFRPRRLLLVAPVAVVLVLLAAGVIANIPRGGDESVAIRSEPTITTQAEGSVGGTTTPLDSYNQEKTRDALTPSLSAPSQPATGALVPSPGRIQRYEAELRVRVEGLSQLSQATQRAQRIAAAAGGFIASLQYDAPREGVGGAQLVVRVPSAKVEDTMRQLSGLGTILGQRFAIQDLQQNVDSLEDQITETRRRIVQLRRSLENSALGEEERVVLQSRLAQARQELADLRSALGGTRAEGRLATISLALTTERIEPAVQQDDDGALDRAGDILRWEAAALLYVAVIAGPLVLLGVLLWLGLRLRRRQVETRLLGQH